MQIFAARDKLSTDGLDLGSFRTIPVTSLPTLASTTVVTNFCLRISSNVMIELINKMNSVTMRSTPLNNYWISILCLLNVTSSFFCSNPHSTLD